MILSLLVVAIIALITYWWMNQGLFSALLHFLCVLVAGTVAFSLWEWATVSFFLRGIRYDEYAWGITLVGIFAIVLLVLRLLSDRLAPNEVRLPGAINYGFGALFGLGAGVLSIGIVLVGWGFVQSSGEVLGYEGFRRTQQGGGVPTQTQGGLPPTWVLNATTSVFGALSVGAFSPIGSDVTFASAMPGLSDLAGSAMRDSFNDGKGKISAPIGSIRAVEFYDLPSTGEGVYLVRLDLDQPAFDRRTMFTLSSSQARLVGASETDPRVSFPNEFGQKNAANDARFQPYAFNDISNFASSPSGAQNATIYLTFPKTPLRGQTPAFLQVKGLRLKLPAVQLEPTISSLSAFLDRRTGGANPFAPELKELLASTEGAPGLGGALIESNNTIAPAAGSINNMPGTLVANDARWLVSGAGDFQRGRDTIGNRDLRINGIYEPTGTRVVRVSASKGQSPIDLYNVDRIRALRKGAGEEAGVELVDRNFDTYQPFGYIWERTGESTVRIYLDLPPGGRWTLRDLPNAGDEDKLYLLYRLPVGTRISGAIFRDPAKPISAAKVAAVADWTVPPAR